MRILLLALLIFTLGFRCPPVKVSGAGAEQINGVYLSNGTFNDHCYWNKKGYPDLYWRHSIYYHPFSNTWVISDDPLIYYTGDAKQPWMVTEWDATLLIDPTPIVTINYE